MKLNQTQERSFAVAILNTYDTAKLNINNESVLRELTAEFIAELKDLNSEETKKARLDRFKVDGVTSNDYSEKYLRIDKVRSIIYGIRNMGCNKDKPFVHIIPNFRISSKKMALEIYGHIKDEFKRFGPLYISFQTKDKIDADFFGSFYMVANTKDIKAREHWPIEDKISFCDITDNSYYEWYKKGYKEFHQDCPNLEDIVQFNSEVTMEDSLKQGLLKFVELNGVRIGIIASEKNDLLGHSGVYFLEIHISKEWKGNGLAKAIQRKYISLFADDLEVVWGTIDSSNIPSLKTAYSNGRRAIRYECFVNL